MTHFRLRFEVACAVSSVIIFGAAQAKRPKATVNAAAVDAAGCEASDVSSGACAATLPADGSPDRASYSTDNSSDATTPRSIKELRQALRELNKLEDDSMAPCDLGQLSIRGEVDSHNDLIVTATDIAVARTDTINSNDKHPSGQLVLKLCPAPARDLQRARTVSMFRFSGVDMPFVAGEPNIINPKGEIRIDRPTQEYADIEAELLRRTCVSQCP
jgi:hypothetical protein